METAKKLCVGCGLFCVVGGFVAFLVLLVRGELGVVFPLLVAIVLSALLWFVLAAVLAYLADIKNRCKAIQTALAELKWEQNRK